MAKKKRILLISEGSYPYYGGGVSTWSHLLCQRINASFYLYSINAGYVEQPIFDLPENVKDIIQVPLWAPDEPQDYISYKRDYYKIALRKENTTREDIRDKFIPTFKRFLDAVFHGSEDMPIVDLLFYDMWTYFRSHDYKVTMKDEQTWETFKAIVGHHIGHQKCTIFDITVSLRWLYRFFIPLSLAVPKVDLTHITLSGFPLIPALVSKYQYGTPIMITEHGVYIRERLLYISGSNYSPFIKEFLIKLTELVTRLSYYKADKILSVNKFNQKWELKFGANRDKLEVTYNGVDHEKFKPNEKPSHLTGIPTVVAAARIFELKDVLTMIKTCEVVSKEIPEVQFLIYGDKNAVPSYTAQCEALIKELKLENNFFLKGHHSEPHKLYSEGDISILTSISEGFPYTVIESMSCGVPVVATDVGGVAEAIDVESGIVCAPKDYQQLGESVIRLLKDDSLRKNMGENARKRVLENFTLDKFAEIYEQQYQSLTELQPA